MMWLKSSCSTVQFCIADWAASCDEERNEERRVRNISNDVGLSRGDWGTLCQSGEITVLLMQILSFSWFQWRHVFSSKLLCYATCDLNFA